MADRRPIGIASIALMSLVLAACAGSPTLQTNTTSEVALGTSRGGLVPETGGNRGPSHAGVGVAELALSLLGSPYEYGGSDPNGFDCSGLVYYTYTQNGHPAPRTSVDQFRNARKIALSEATAGDLVFFQDEVKLSHVGIYLGGDRFVHAPASGRRVSIASLSNPYYQEHLVAVARLLPN